MLRVAFARGSLYACGLKIMVTGPTFIADHYQADGSVTESWLDQVSQISAKIINYGSSDHLPVLTSLNVMIIRKSYKMKIMKRKMKIFTNEAWRESLAKQNWADIKMNPIWIIK